MRTATENVIRELRKQNEEAAEELVTAGLTIARLRDANKKLRADLESQRLCARDNWNSWCEQQGITSAWKAAHRQLAEAIGGKAK